MSEKSPISLLQEYYIKRGLVPQYTSLTESNTNAGPFTMKVEVDGRSAVGSGSSKKQAKHNAASAMLKQLKKSASSNNQEGTNHEDVPTQPTVKKDVQIPPIAEIPVLNRPIRPNFVGKLHEYMIKRKSTTVPKYDLVNEDGPPHMRQFTMRCTVKDIQEEGIARSKQEAKNIAAEKVWEKLQCDEGVEECSKPKRRKLVDDSHFNEVLKEFRSVIDDLGGSFHFEEETPKEYAIDAGGNAEELENFDENDKKMFSFLGTRSFTSLLPEKTSIILSIDTGADSHTIGARGWTRRNAMFKAISDGIEYLSKLNNKVEKNGEDKQPEDVET